MTTQREMPRYKCHKEVHALKIAREVPPRKEKSDPLGQRGWIVPVDEGFDPIPVSQEWYERCTKAARSKENPLGELAGGYLVVYADGYTSWSPAKAFEEGYTRIAADGRG